jgi:uncharacterized protein (TIGR01777 family)
MKIIMTGSSGLIGSALTAALRGAGHPVTPLVRQAAAPPGAISWNPLAERMDAAPLAGTQAVIHLAGESLAEGRWTTAKKERMYCSRVQATDLLARTLTQLRPLPRVLLCASAVGYYGSRGDEVLSEEMPPGTGYAADLCRQWEAASAPAAAAGIRVVHMRLGIVLSAAGGALGKMLTPFRLGLGGKIGNGKQYMSWIALDDVVAAMIHLLAHSQLAGAVNLVAPQAVTNRQFTMALGHALHRPTLFFLPAFAARLAMGEMADELLLASARVAPTRLLADGFAYQYPELRPALLHALGKGI